MPAQTQHLEVPLAKPSPPKVVITDPLGVPAEEKKKKDKKKSDNQEVANMDENWKLIREKEKDLSERLKELESQQFALE